VLVAGELVDSVAVDAADSVVPGCAPPLLLIVTPGATSSVDDVAPAVVVSVVVVLLPPDADPPPVEDAGEPVVSLGDVATVVPDVAADPVDDVPDVEPAETDDEDDSEDAPVVSAAATPWPVATAVTSHAATARPP